MEGAYSFFAEPGEFEATSFGKYPLAFDFSAWIDESDLPPSNPTARLIRQPEKTAYPDGVLSIGLDGTTVVVNVGSLEPKHDYYLIVSVTLSPVKVPTAVILIRVPM